MRSRERVLDAAERVMAEDSPMRTGEWASIDGAFVAWQTDPGVTLATLLEPLAPSLVASHRAFR